MAAISSPYGFKPVNLIGGLPFAGSTREIRVSTNNAAAIYNGDLVVINSAGQPAAVAASPTAGTTAGIVGVCLGARYVNSATKQPLWSQFLPAGAISAGFTDVFLIVCDDPNTIFQIQGDAAFGTLTNGAAGAVGKNCAIANFTGSVTTGNSAVRAVVGANGGSLASTAALAFRVIGTVAGTELDAFPELLVKYNGATHSYNFATGV